MIPALSIEHTSLVDFGGHDLDHPYEGKVIRGPPRRGRGVDAHCGKCLRRVDPDAIEGEERLPGRPGARPGRLPEVRTELTECTRQEEPFVDIPKAHGEAAWVPDNRLSKALHLEPPFPWRQAKMSCDDADHSAVDCDVDVKGTPGLTRRDVQVNAPYRQDWQA